MKVPTEKEKEKLLAELVDRLGECADSIRGCPYPSTLLDLVEHLRTFEKVLRREERDEAVLFRGELDRQEN